MPRGRPPTTLAKLGLDEPLRSEFADYLKAKDDSSVKTVVGRAIEAYMKADLKANPGFDERYQELRKSRRQQSRNGLRAVTSDKAC
jgi:hypothetical protein